MAVITTTVTIPAGVISSNDILTSGGEFQVTSGGSIVGTIVAQGGAAFISAGGMAAGTTLQNNITSTGGSFGELVEGVAISTLVASGGDEVVEFGRRDLRSDGASGRIEEHVGWHSEAGNAVGMTVNGGSAVILAEALRLGPLSRMAAC